MSKNTVLIFLTFYSMQRRWFNSLAIGATTVAMVATFVPAMAFAAAPANMEAITVTGSGKVTVAADLAQLSFNLTAHEKSAKEAYKKLTEQTKTVATTLSQFGITDKDVQITWYNMYPTYKYDEMGQQSGVDYFDASRTVNVNLRQLDKVNDVLDALADKEIYSLSSVNYMLEKRVDAQDQAREAASTDAKRRADAIAKTLGVNLGRVVSAVEYNYDYGPIYGTGSELVDVTMNLEVSYEIAQ